MWRFQRRLVVGKPSFGGSLGMAKLVVKIKNFLQSSSLAEQDAIAPKWGAARLGVGSKVKVRMRIANRKTRNDACLDRNLTFFRKMIHNFVHIKEFDLQSSLSVSRCFVASLTNRPLGKVTHNKRAHNHSTLVSACKWRSIHC